MGFFNDLKKNIEKVVDTVQTNVVKPVQDTVTQVVNTVTAVPNQVTQQVQKQVATVQTVVQEQTQRVQNAVQDAVNAVASNPVVDFVAKNNIVAMAVNPDESVVVQTVQNAVEGVQDAVGGVVDNVGGFFGSVGDKVQGVFDGLASVPEKVAKAKWLIIGGVGIAVVLVIYLKTKPIRAATRVVRNVSYLKPGASAKELEQWMRDK